MKKILKKLRSALAKNKDALFFMALIIASMVIAAIVEDTDAADWLFIPAMAILIAFALLELAFLWHSLQCARRKERYGKR